MENLLFFFASFLFLAFCFFYLLLDTTTVSIENKIDKALLIFHMTIIYHDKRVLEN
jgi:hypothetical protein